MDYTTYIHMRGYALDALKDRLKGEVWDSTAAYVIAGGSGLAALQHEAERARYLVRRNDPAMRQAGDDTPPLAPKELAAAQLLNVISQYRCITWMRERQTPDGSAPLPPLTLDEAAAAWAQTRQAAVLYASHLPDRQAAALMALLDAAIGAGLPSSTSTSATPSGVTPIPTTDDGEAWKLQHIEGLTTGAAAYALRDIHFSMEQWTDNLQDGRVRWLKECRIRPGKKGNAGAQSLWNPIELAKRIATNPRLIRDAVKRSEAVKKLDSRFAREDGLKPFRDDWVEFSDAIRRD